MAREYWVESLPSGRPRFVKPNPLRRSNTHDGSQSSRGRRVDFLDVTREEYNAILSRERTLRRATDDLTRENQALRANWRTCDNELRKLQGVVPALETAVRKLEYENGQLRQGHHHHRDSREREDELRKLRHRNTRLRNENDSLLSRVGRLERELRDGVGDRARRLAEEVAAWKRRCGKADDLAERLHHKLDSVARRNERLVTANESYARQDRKLRTDLELSQAILRRHGIPTR